AKAPEYWIDGSRAPGPDSKNGFQGPLPANLAGEWQRVGLAKVTVPADLAIATDDWPFLYLRQPMIPDLSLRGAAVMAGLALLLLSWFLPPRTLADGGGWRQEARQVLGYWLGRKRESDGLEG